MVASQGFKEGRHYWEVDIGCNKSWHVGVCRDDVDRKKDVTLSPINGYWVLGQETENLYFVNNPNRIHLSLTTNPIRVGIFLNYNAGILSFFNTDDHTLIYTLTRQFEGLLRPFIEHSPSDEENVTPIFICSVLQRKKPVLKKYLYALPHRKESPKCPCPSSAGRRQERITFKAFFRYKLSFSDPKPYTASRNGI
jgi:hypothetical protein